MKHDLFGVRIDDVSPADLDMKLEDWLAGNQSRVIVTPNAEFLLESRKDLPFVDLLNRSDLAVADSVSLQYAIAALSDHRLAYRIPGVDLLESLCELAVRHPARILLLGGDLGAAQASAQKLRQRFESLDVIALDPGRISWNGNRLTIDNGLVENINAMTPNIVAVALGQHKQEQFIDQVRSRCPSVRIWIGVGGAFEMISGQKRRAPQVMSRLGLEWLWRLLIEPHRARRIFNASVVFPLLVAHEAFRRGTFLRSTQRVSLEVFRTMITTPSPSLKRRGIETYER
ncbi:MAG: WecB/TagA/CpsF family glycosyltransferase [Candidatus Uhrbacteria bacterium]|nr:WecB/TagA/CpsF family glycosyltransferase [Candidatus Uhrbacteria bacterium]